MNRKETTKQLSEMVESHFNNNKDTRVYLSKEVTFDYSSAHPIRVDYVLFKPINNTVGGIEQGAFYCFEIKSCKEDFYSGHGLNFIGDYNYLILPTEKLYNEIKTSIKNTKLGVYIPNGYGQLKCIKTAQKQTRTRSCSEFLLMMFRSANRENIKTKQGKEQL